MRRQTLLALLATSMLAGAAQAQEGAPHVVATFPPADAVVPAGIEVISATYDRPMAEGSSFVTGGEKAFPEVNGGPSRSDDHKTVHLPVKLRPHTAYVIWLNSDRYQNFKDEQGRAATPYRLSFTTSE